MKRASWAVGTVTLAVALATSAGDKPPGKGPPGGKQGELHFDLTLTTATVFDELGDDNVPGLIDWDGRGKIYQHGIDGVTTEFVEGTGNFRFRLTGGLKKNQDPVRFFLLQFGILNRVHPNGTRVDETAAWPMLANGAALRNQYAVSPSSFMTINKTGFWCDGAQAPDPPAPRDMSADDCTKLKAAIVWANPDDNRSELWLQCGYRLDKANTDQNSSELEPINAYCSSARADGQCDDWILFRSDEDPPQPVLNVIDGHANTFLHCRLSENIFKGTKSWRSCV